MTEIENKLLLMLKDEPDHTRCTFKVYLEKDILNKDDNKHCLMCDGYQTVIDCRYFCSVSHYLHFYERFRYGVKK